MFPGFDGLMTLSRREGVDIRPTLLRVLTDSYVRTSRHSADEERQYVELATRLIDQVDDATRAMVRTRLAAYPNTPAAITTQLERYASAAPAVTAPLPVIEEIIETAPMFKARPATPVMQTSVAMPPADAADISEIFFAAREIDRLAMLSRFAQNPVKPHLNLPTDRLDRAIAAMEQFALAGDVRSFTGELGAVLTIDPPLAEQIVEDMGGEPLACAMKALGMPAEIYQRVLMFLNRRRGQHVDYVFRLARLYDTLSYRGALVLVASWRGASLVPQRAPVHRSGLYDDERGRARAATDRNSFRTGSTERRTNQGDGTRGFGR